MAFLSEVKVLSIKNILERQNRDRGFHPLKVFQVNFEYTHYMNADEPDLLEGAQFVFKEDNQQFYNQVRDWAEKSGWLGLNLYVHEDDISYFSMLSPDLWTQREVRRWLRDLMNDLEHDEIEGIG